MTGFWPKSQHSSWLTAPTLMVRRFCLKGCLPDSWYGEYMFALYPWMWFGAEVGTPFWDSWICGFPSFPPCPPFMLVVPKRAIFVTPLQGSAVG